MLIKYKHIDWVFPLKHSEVYLVEFVQSWNMLYCV